MGYCHYCQQEKTLIDAHILPREFYINNSDNPKVKYVGILKDGSFKYWQCGFYDRNILCGDCDNIIGEYDKEAYRLLLDINSKKQLINWNGAKAYHYKKGEFDYEKIRKFFISLIWRASISKAKTCESINLGKYESLALELLKDNIKNDNLFKTIVSVEDAPNEFTNVHYIMKTRYDGCVAYAVYFAQFAAYIIPKFEKSMISNLNAFYKLAINDKDFIIIQQPSLAKIKKNFLNKTFGEAMRKKDTLERATKNLDIK